MTAKQRSARLWCSVYNEFLPQIDALCSRWEKRLHRAKDPCSRALARMIYTQEKEFARRVVAEMKRLGFEFFVE